MAALSSRQQCNIAIDVRRRDGSQTGACAAYPEQFIGSALGGRAARSCILFVRLSVGFNPDIEAYIARF